jgi:hypothetical protein
MNPPSGANVPTRNRFALLSADSILAPLPVHAVPTIQTPGGWEAQFDTQHPDTPHPMSMVPPRPPTVLPQSPTVTLEPMQEPESYTYLDTTYGSLDEVLHQTAADASIPPNVLMWMKATITEVCAVQIRTAYNQLSRKMYKHKASVDQALVNVHLAMDAMADEYQQQLALAEQNTTAMRRNYDDMQQRVAIKTVEIGQLQNELAVLNHNQSQLVTALCQVSADNATLHGHIIALEKEVLVLKSAPAPVASTLIFTPHVAPAPVAPTGPSQPHLPCIPALPKFSSNTKDLLLESWLQSIGVWFRYYNMTNNHTRIISALNLLEGGAALFMDEYSKQASIGNTLGTWDNFVKRLETGYWNIAPEKYAQEQLDKICGKKHNLLSCYNMTLCSSMPIRYAHRVSA